MGYFMGGVAFTGNLVLLTVLWYGGEKVLDYEMTVGNLNAYMLYTIYLVMNTIGVAGVANKVTAAIAIAEKLFEMMDAEEKITNGTVKPLQEIQGKITF